MKSAVEGCKIWKKDNMVSVSDLEGDKDQIGGIFILDAKDLEEAKLTIGKHPALKIGWFQIRPVDEELTTLVGVNEIL